MNKKEKNFKRIIKIKKLLKDGHSYQEVANKFGLRAEYIKLVEKFKRIFDPTVPDFEAREDKKILKMLRQGATPAEIKSQMGVPEGHIRQVGMDHGIIKPYYERKTGERDKKILESLKQGSSFAEAGRQYNLTRERIRVIAARHGFEGNARSTDKKAVIKLARKDLPLEQIAQKFKVTLGTIRKIIQESGIPELQPRTKWKERITKRNKIIAQAIKGGMTYAEVARIFNMDRAYIRMIARQNGIYKKPLFREFKQRHKRIKKLAKEGKSINAIANIMRMHPVSISSIIRKQAIPSSR